ncbi:MAG: ATP-binding cassette domain-containing protein [Bdellovibrionaceae bacterium]|nr:ATP-binding cassette domain-containing protein [Bdellovibrionales bacterium]MCB9085334.1 ATP-binding cassette domain-containing protein [Pseudobdellovibrionaceae bacterium]
MSSLIELKDLGISFAGENLLSGIQLSLAKGEVFVLVGPSGQGKSVLLKMMAGILEPTAGEVIVEGKNLYTASFDERTEIMHRMGMLFQKNALFDSLTCADNIAFPLKEVSHMADKEIQQRIDYFLEEVGIPHAKNLFPDEISGGMQKRLGIARALALDPEIIFYDDPTAGLDPITSKRIIELIIRLQKEKNSTVIAITNDMNRAYQMADRIGMVVDGGLIITGSVSETKAHQDKRVHQFINGKLQGPLTASP